MELDWSQVEFGSTLPTMMEEVVLKDVAVFFLLIKSLSMFFSTFEEGP